MKTDLSATFRTEIFQLADLLDQQETTAFEQLNLRFNQTATTPSLTQIENHSPKATAGKGFSSSDSVPKSKTMETKPTTATGNRRRKHSLKQGERESRPQSAATSDGNSVDLDSTSVSIADEKASPKVGQRRKTMDPSQKYGPTPTTPTGKPASDLFSSQSTAAVALLNKPLTNPPSPTASTATAARGGSSPPVSSSSSSSNPLSIIKHASYHISKQKLIKKFELRKFYQSTQQDKQFIHSLRFEFVSFVFSLLIKESMTNYMTKEYNLLENKLLSRYAKEMEDLNVLQAKELAVFIHSKPYLQHQQQQMEEGGTDTEDPSGHLSSETNNGSEAGKGVLLRHASSIAEVNPTSSSHQFHIPLDFETIGDDMSLLRRHHEENKTKFENYLLEKRRVKRKQFDDAKNLTLEKLAAKLQDIKTEAENAMLSPGALGKYRNILRIANCMKNNLK
jgi:hypothetical protein